MVTNKYVVNLAGFERKRAIAIGKIKALTKTLEPNGLCCIHIEDEYDYVFDCKRRPKLFLAIKE